MKVAPGEHDASCFGGPPDDLEAAGPIVSDVAFSQAAGYYEAWRTAVAVETGQSHSATYPARKADYGKDLAALLEVASMPPTSAQDALRDPLAVLARARGGEADTVLAGIDVLATPTQRQPPYTIAEAEQLYERSDLAELENRAAAQNVAVFDLTGQPAISVPCDFSSDGMPVGLMLVAKRWDELALLRAARAYEQIRGPFSMPPI